MSEKKIRLRVDDIVLPSEYKSRHTIRAYLEKEREKRRLLDESEDLLERAIFTRGIVLYGEYRDIRYLNPKLTEMEQVVADRKPSYEEVKERSLQQLRDQVRSDALLARTTPTLAGSPRWLYVPEFMPVRHSRSSRVLSDGNRIIRVIGDFPIRDAA